MIADEILISELIMRVSLLLCEVTTSFYYGDFSFSKKVRNNIYLTVVQISIDI